jgi:hypothetical protein
LLHRYVLDFLDVFDAICYHRIVKWANALTMSDLFDKSDVSDKSNRLCGGEKTGGIER